MAKFIADFDELCEHFSGKSTDLIDLPNRLKGPSAGSSAAAVDMRVVTLPLWLDQNVATALCTHLMYLDSPDVDPSETATDLILAVKAAGGCMFDLAVPLRETASPFARMPLPHVMANWCLKTKKVHRKSQTHQFLSEILLLGWMDLTLSEQDELDYIRSISDWVAATVG